MTIYVGNLVYDVTTDDLKEVFAEYGTVSRVYLPVDRETGKMRGFGFVEMSSDEEEAKAIETLDGAEWMGRQMKVNAKTSGAANVKQILGKFQKRLFLITAFLSIINKSASLF